MNAKSRLEGKKKKKKAKKAHTSRLRDHALLIILGISYTLCCGGKYPYPRHTMFSGLKTVTHLKISFLTFPLMLFALLRPPTPL